MNRSPVRDPYPFIPLTQQEWEADKRRIGSLPDQIKKAAKAQEHAKSESSRQRNRAERKAAERKAQLDAIQARLEVSGKPQQDPIASTIVQPQQKLQQNVVAPPVTQQPAKPKPVVVPQPPAAEDIDDYNMSMEAINNLEWVDDEVNVALILVDHTYQRPLVMSRVYSMAKAFKPVIFKPIHVNIRADGRMFVFNGQHRVELAKQLSIPRIKAHVFMDLTQQQEAYLFAELAQAEVHNSRIGQFRARTAAGQPLYGAVMDIVLKCGFNVDYNHNRSTRAGQIMSVPMVMRLYESSDIGATEPTPDRLANTLMLVQRVWPDVGNAAAAPIMGAFDLMLRTYGSKLDTDRLAYVLKYVEPRKYTSVAAGRSDTPKVIHTVAELIIADYNKRLTSNRLPPLPPFSRKKV